MNRKEKNYVTRLATRTVIGRMQRFEPVIDHAELVVELLAHPALRYLSDS